MGTGLVIASACVVNNIIDRDIDARMKRTAKRPSVVGAISITDAVLFAIVLAGLGFWLLAGLTNVLTVAIGLVAYISYALIYTLSKRFTAHSTLIGTLPGALPLVGGYTAVSGALDALVGWLFVALVIWQLPHFYAIGIFRAREYKSAGIELLTARLGDSRSRRLMICLVAVYLVLCLVLAVWYLEWQAGTLLAVFAGWWLGVSLHHRQPMIKWARQVFGGSLIVTVGLFVVSVINFVASSYL